ncbi:MAG: hypothetical protein M1839_004172 [Geoglossum umbratile]|nr:MAG: hypothetical protein M1839_004172 [Geoglossum umbratile]
MPEQETSDEYGASNAISPELADAARQEILNSITASNPDLGDQPWDYRPYSTKTREAVKEFIENGDKEILARLTNLPAENVADRFHRAYPILFRNTKALHLPGGLPNHIWTFVAFGELMFENGLPALGPSNVKHELGSGHALHVKGDVDMWFSGTGGGTALIIDWKFY